MLKKVVLASTGSVAIFAVPNLILTLRRAFATEIILLMSLAATRFVTPYGLSTISGGAVVSPDDEPVSDDALQKLMFRANVLAIVPATANSIADLVAGTGVSLPVRSAMLFSGPVVVAPAMNEKMWKNPSTTRNLQRLHELRINVVGPSKGIEVNDLGDSATSLASVDEIISKLIEVA